MTVALVGAGPGDPELITVRGLERLRTCDAVVYDRLVAPELVDEAPPARSASRATVSARSGSTGCSCTSGGGPRRRPAQGATVPVRSGRRRGARPRRRGRPVRGRPRGLVARGRPGRSRHPVTHRGVADTVTLTTAHGADGSEPDYGALVAAGGTLVLFMGLGRLQALSDGLVAAGLAPDTPAAVISPRHLV